jgi:hypothetical protein
LINPSAMGERTRFRLHAKRTAPGRAAAVIA